MAEMIDSPVAAPTLSGRESRRNARLGCQKELMKKPGKVNNDSASTTEEKHSSASTEKHFDRDSNSEYITEEENSLGYAQSGLKLYQKINNGHDTLFDFGSIEILSFKKLWLFQLGSNLTEFWKHVCFTAKPENDNASPKYYFLVEVRKGLEGRWKARRCWMFKHNDDAGMDHGCIICTNEVKIHPVAGQYYAGHTRTCIDATKGYQKRGKVNKDSASTEEKHCSTSTEEKHYDRDSMLKLLRNSENMSEKNNRRLLLAYAQSGLELYQRINKDTLFDFKNIEVLSYKRLRIHQLGTNRTELWLHIFVATKPENSDASPKYFLVEVMRDPKGYYKARRCWMFEPKDVEGV